MLSNYRSFFLFVFATALITSTSHAQQRGNTQVEIIPEKTPSLFTRNAYTVEFLDKPYNSISKFTMRLASYGEVSGCASMTKSKVDVKDTMESKNIEVKDSELKLDNKMPRYTNHDCETKHNRSFFDIVLDRDQLINNNVKEIKLVSEKYGEFTTSEIETTKQKMDMTIKSPGGKILLTYWFLPENTIVLHTPYAKSGQNTKDLITKFARQQGLLPVEKQFEGYHLPYHVEHHALFIDRWNRIIPHLEAPETRTIVGQIAPTRTVYGVNGPTEETYDLDVYAVMPKQQATLIKRK